MNIKAAHYAHPRNMYKKMRETNGFQEALFKRCRTAFYKLSRSHPKWQKGLSNDAVDYVMQRGIWADGTLISKCKGQTVTAFWEEVAAIYDKDDLKDLMLDFLAYIIESGESERVWCLFQKADPKGYAFD